MTNIVDRIQEFHSRLTADAVVLGLASLVVCAVGLLFNFTMLANFGFPFWPHEYQPTAQDVGFTLIGTLSLTFAGYLYHEAKMAMFRS